MAHSFHPDTPHVEIKDEGEMGTTKGARRVTSLDMAQVEGYKNFMPRMPNDRQEDVLNELDLDRNSVSPRRTTSSTDSYYGEYENGNFTAREQGYTPRSPKRVVRVAPREKKRFNNWKKYEKMYEEDRKNNLNPLFMSSMCEYDDPWTRECK